MTNNSPAALLRALRGPLSLILTGSLFAVDHAGWLSFTKSWPILIIFMGVIRLAERAALGREAPPPPYSPTGGAL